jgi:hypothetical protein
MAQSHSDIRSRFTAQTQQGGRMADLRELADQTAEELLKAIRDQAGEAGGSTLLQLAQAYSMVVSTEVSTRLADEGATQAAEYEATLGAGASIAPVSSISPE